MSEPRFPTGKGCPILSPVSRESIFDAFKYGWEIPLVVKKQNNPEPFFARVLLLGIVREEGGTQEWMVTFRDHRFQKELVARIVTYQLRSDEGDLGELWIPG